MLARWFSVTFEYRPGAQHANADGLSRQCGQYILPDCPVSSADVGVGEAGSTSELVDQPFANSAIPRFHGFGFITGTLEGNMGGCDLT